MKHEVIVIGSDCLGSGDDKLGRLLMGNFLRILGDRPDLPAYIILWNNGVKTAASGSDTVDFLKRLEERGVEIISCRTCVEYFEMESEIAVGKVEGFIRILDVISNHQVLAV